MTSISICDALAANVMRIGFYSTLKQFFAGVFMDFSCSTPWAGMGCIGADQSAKEPPVCRASARYGYLHTAPVALICKRPPACNIEVRERPDMAGSRKTRRNLFALGEANASCSTSHWDSSALFRVAGCFTSLEPLVESRTQKTLVTYPPAYTCMVDHEARSGRFGAGAARENVWQLPL